MKKTTFPIRIEVRMTREQFRVVKEIARKLETTMNEAIRIAIREYWERI